MSSEVQVSHTQYTLLPSLLLLTDDRLDLLQKLLVNVNMTSGRVIGTNGFYTKIN